MIFHIHSLHMFLISSIMELKCDPKSTEKRSFINPFIQFLKIGSSFVIWFWVVVDLTRAARKRYSIFNTVLIKQQLE